MQSQTHKRYLVYLLLVATFALSAASAISQERKALSANDELPQVGPALPCPFPQLIHLAAPPPTAATPNLADFPTGACSAGFEPNFGGTTGNRCFRHTFTWRPASDCCQPLKGTLTIRYKALQGGPAGSSSSANDGFAIYSNHSVVSGTSQSLFSGNVTTGQVGTKTIALTAAMLSNNRLSFLVQDDTAVLSATLDVDLCCVRK